MSLSSEDIVPEYFRGQKDDLTSSKKAMGCGGNGRIFEGVNLHI